MQLISFGVVGVVVVVPGLASERGRPPIGVRNEGAPAHEGRLVATDDVVEYLVDPE